MTGIFFCVYTSEKEKNLLLLIPLTSKPVMTLQDTGCSCPIVRRKMLILFPLYVELIHQLLWTKWGWTPRVQKGVSLNHFVTFDWFDLYWDDWKKALFIPSPCMSTSFGRNYAAPLFNVLWPRIYNWQLVIYVQNCRMHLLANFTDKAIITFFAYVSWLQTTKTNSFPFQKVNLFSLWFLL